MAEFKITRFRYIWKGDWNTSVQQYNRDDVVFYEGSAWVCIRQHEPTVFDNDQTFTPAGETLPAPAWVKMVDGRQFSGNWTSGQRYDPGVLILSGGNVYLCVASHVSSTNFNSDLINWEIFATGSNFRDQWTPSTRYRVGDVIRYNGYTYQCILEHTSSTTSEGIVVGNDDLNDDSTFETWKILTENYTFVGNYQNNFRYRKNDLVKYGGSILKCIDEHQSPVTIGAIDSEKFETYLPGFEYDPTWNNSTYYAIGDVVRFGGIVYVAAENNFNSQPGVSDAHPLGNTKWTIVDKAVDFRGEFVPLAGTLYRQGDLVRRGGALWLSLINQTFGADSSIAVLDDSNWEIVISAYNFRGTWRPSTPYNINDLVYFKGIVYYANFPHTGSVDNFPGDNGSGFEYWTVAIVGDVNAALTNLGDLITYNLTRDIIQDGVFERDIGDKSTFGNTNIPIGEEDEALIVENNQGDIGYRVWGEIQRVFFVRTTGVDDDTDPNRGTNYFKPYRTVRFALEKADDGFEGFTTIKVSTGEYQEVLPLIIPRRTSVVGEELRSTTIRANEPIPALASDAQYTLETLIRLGLIIPNILQGLSITKSISNELDPDMSSTVSLSTASIVDNLWSNIIDVIQHKVNDTGLMPTVTGSNVPTTDAQRLTAIEALENNREFIKAEAIAYMTDENPLYNFNTELCLRDLDRYINAVQYDLRHPGNYKSVLAGRYYANAVVGSQLEDMFYVRDTTGIRNMTLKGLEGTLPDLQPGQVYRIPTGGAFVSLDPGWGPDDDRTWVLNRSCYIQNVTTFGTGAVGQKIDGEIHNGGNRSIVSNDFTQVISDGIGAWVLNGGRAELVSVFTYYAHIGMFAKNGGIIRATNGNSSYGDFGAVADGIDDAETPRFAKVNTRTEQAVVDSAFAGEILDFILGLEFRNCGQHYTAASYSITSSGTGAVAIQEEFRDNAMFECQVVRPGSGYRLFGNQAQGGNTTSITLASAETATEAQILGMRLIITSGEGTGQYGYVDSYDSGTKICNIRKETTGEPGWDHILPGTPVRSFLTTGTRYRIEPRPIFSTPTEFNEESTLLFSNSWASAVYGETSGTFTNVVGTAGTGTTVDVTPIPARWTVNKLGRTYNVVLTNPGAGYQPNDIIVLLGADLDGVTGIHDIEIRVLTTSDDSTNSILTWEYADDTLVADSGKFILAPLTGDSGRYSADGANWDEFVFPSQGNWKCLAAGDNKFVAIRNNSNQAASSTNGIVWTARTMPTSRNWNAVAYGKNLNNGNNGVFLAVAGDLNSGAYSTNGTSWTSVTLPVAGDSTLNEWVDVAYGFGKFVVLANSNNLVANMEYNSLTDTWIKDWHVMDVVADSSAKDWVSIAYGNRRFVAIASTGEVAYSFDGENWLAAELPTQDGSTRHNWKKIAYGQGVFMAIGDTGGRTVGGEPTVGPSDFVALSYDGIIWRTDNLSTTVPQSLGVIAFGNPDISLDESTVSNSRPMFVIAPDISSPTVIRYFAGAQILGRIVVEGAGLSYVKIWEPGSNYIETPTLTIVDPNKITNPDLRFRLADGVLAQPTFITKGNAYKTSTTFVTVSGDGFADITPVGRFITIDDLEVMPNPGAQFYIGGRGSFYTAVIVGVDEETLPNGKIRSKFQISPRPTVLDNLQHDMEVLIRERYSQVRITGHDFLDVGTGNFEETNYPELYKNFEFTTEPFQEVQNLNGGRVFYTSTDQDGNFRAGELFAVEQATGIITISADFFDLRGLTELRLGGIIVGSTAVIREFSKDPLFKQDSNNVIPTQRAIISYLQSRLNIGGEDLLTPSFIAGTVRVGPNLISNVAGLTVDIPVVADFSGDGTHISGSILAQTMFYRSFGLGAV